MGLFGVGPGRGRSCGGGGSRSDPFVCETNTYHTKVSSNLPTKDSNDGWALLHMGQHSFVFSMHI